MAPRVRLGLLVALVTLALVPLAATGQPGSPPVRYAWPVKPFDQPHPVRSVFGEPRTLFHGQPTIETLYHGSGAFSFHAGIDVAAPDGAAVYPVTTGIVTFAAACKVIVRSDDGVSFQYWHIVPVVRPGQRVAAYTDVLGHIRTTYGHVHLLETQDGRPVNPLAQLTPYVDTTAPVIDRIVFRRPGSSADILPELVRGRVELDVPVSDTPTVAAPGEWATMKTAPAYVSWRVESARTHAVQLRDRAAFDARHHVRSNRDFWSVYARGTRQNDPTFHKHRFWRQDGVFLFRLGVVDTTQLKDGIYSVVVTARDIRENTATRRQTFLVYNHRLWPPDTDQR
jgi:hypothetical protein